MTAQALQANLVGSSSLSANVNCAYSFLGFLMGAGNIVPHLRVNHPIASNLAGTSMLTAAVASSNFFTAHLVGSGILLSHGVVHHPLNIQLEGSGELISYLADDTAPPLTPVVGKVYVPRTRIIPLQVPDTHYSLKRHS